MSEWSTGLCSCFSDCDTFLLGCCCLPCLVGCNEYEMDGRPESYCLPSFCYPHLNPCTWLCSVLLAAYLRDVYRNRMIMVERENIDSNGFYIWLIGTCLPCCSEMQIARQLKN